VWRTHSPQGACRRSPVRIPRGVAAYNSELSMRREQASKAVLKPAGAPERIRTIAAHGNPH